MTRKVKFLLALVLLASLLSGSHLWPAEKIRVAAPSKTNPFYYLPLIAAQEKGFWADQGLDGEAVLLASSIPLMGAISTGSVFSGINAATGTLSWIYRGTPLTVIGDMGNPSIWYMYVRRESPAKAAADLKGGKIGISRLGSVTHGYARAFVRAAGLEKDIKIVATGGITSTIAGMRTGVIEATPLQAVTMIPLELEGVVRRLVPLAQYAPSDADTVTIFATQEAVAKKPEVLKKMLAGLLKGMDFTTKNLSWATQTIKNQSGMTGPAATAAFETLQYSSDGRISRARLEKINNFLVEYRLVAAEKPLGLERLYTKEFAPVQ